VGGAHGRPQLRSGGLFPQPGFHLVQQLDLVLVNVFRLSPVEFQSTRLLQGNFDIS
jgi:hypothetical protein